MKEISYALVFYPDFKHEGLNRFREKYDPSYPVYREHMPLLHFIPASVTFESLDQHLTRVLSPWKPFEVHFSGLFKSWDHWLLLGVCEGSGKVRELHKQIYTGILKPFLREDLPFEPHIGLGLFAQNDYDPFAPARVGLKVEEYEIANHEVNSLDLDFWSEVKILDLIRGKTNIITYPQTIRKYDLSNLYN
jgi:2'-5' RNA ligase